MTLPTTSTQKLRVLCLHGFRTNVQVMQNQMRGMCEALGSNAEFVYLNGPLEANGPTDEVILRAHAKDAPFYEWCRIRYLEPKELEAELSRVSDMGNEWQLHFGELDQALEYVEEKIEELGPFDIAVGFSQGAVMLTVLAQLYLKEYNRCPWKLTVCVGGVAVHGANVRDLFETSQGKTIHVDIPSIHIAGLKDPLHDESVMLSHMYTEYPTSSPMKRLFLEHDGGHKFPSPGRNKAFYEHFAQMVYRFLDDSSKSAFARL